MLDFQEITRNIASESKKVGYNTETDTNYCHLPMEMRMECMKWMGFKDRCLLRRTSRLEKLLVDAKKYRFAKLRIVYDSIDKDWLIKEGKRMKNCNLWTERLVHCTGNVTKHLQYTSAIITKGVVESFEFFTQHKRQIVEKYLAELAKCAPFQFKRVTVYFELHAKFFLENCANLEQITLKGDPSIRLKPFDLLSLPPVINAKIRINRRKIVQFDAFIIRLIEKWIDKDAEVGKSLQSIVNFRGAVDQIAFKFADRIIGYPKNEVTIQMNDSNKQILARCIGFDRDDEYISCKVVPIDLPKEKYGIGDEWIDWEFRSQYDEQLGGENPYNDV